MNIPYKKLIQVVNWAFEDLSLCFRESPFKEGHLARARSELFLIFKCFLLVVFLGFGAINCYRARRKKRKHDDDILLPSFTGLHQRSPNGRRKKSSYSRDEEIVAPTRILVKQ